MSIRKLYIPSLLAVNLLLWLSFVVGRAQAQTNTLLGTGAGTSLTTGDDNTLLGYNAGHAITTSNYNTLVGSYAGRNTTGCCNAFFGDYAGANLTTGLGNTYLGNSAGYNNQTGSGNVFLGNSAGATELGSDKLYIDNSLTSSPLIYGEFDTNLIGINGALGVGTQIPLDQLHVRDGNLRIEQTGATHAILNFVSNGKTWEIKNNQATGRLTFFSPGGGASTASFKFDRQATENLLRVGVLGPNIVDINGNLMVTGTITPDYVFTPEYHLESIEAHAAYMWEHQHLPAVGPGQVNAQGQGMVNVGARSQGVLEELEKAHIYIEQLHGKMNALKSESDDKREQISALTKEVAALRDNESKVERLQDEVAALKALVQRLMTRDQNAGLGKEG